MRIRTFFLVCFCGVAVTGGITSLWQSADAWDDWSRASRAGLATRAVSDAQRAQTAVAVEVGAYSPLLRSPAPDIASSQRAAPETDRLLRQAVESVAAAGLDAAPVRDLLARVVEMRDRSLAEMRRPLAERDAAMPTAAQQLRNSGVETMARLAAAASRQVVEMAPDAGLVLEVANAVMEARDFAGRRNTAISSWVLGQPVTAAGMDAALQQTGRVEQAWQTAQRLIAALPSNPALQAALEEQRRVFQGESEPRWRQHLERAWQALQGRPVIWPMPAEEYRPWSIVAQARMLSLRDAALDGAMALVEAGAARARLRLAAALGLAMLAAAMAGISVLLLLRRVVLPLQALTQLVTRIAGGELSLVVPGRDRRDELGSMASAIETLRANSAERQAMAAAQQEEQRQQLARAERVDTLLRRFEGETAEVLRTLAASAARMDSTAANMVDIAASGNGRATAVARASEQASGNVQTVAAAAEELTASIAEVARQVRAGAARAQAAAEAAANTDRTVRGLSEAASRIGDVVQLISGIAGQTNLLALNATIEAARAGESGKGFAVVAGEVKNLASQTARATEEIGQQIAAMQAETGRTVQAIAEIGRMIRELNDATGAVAEAAQQQAEATQEIGRAVAEAASGTQEASHHAAGVSEDAARTGAAAEEVRGAAGDLAQQSGGLRVQMDGFLSALRAA
ncbi:methyl-accepting chemotaxis protein [Teichococcus aestuarii]|uniref:methyl-accepting chemotaxis protein n=1 Tax=Teichococcus aestuarii TaxID=568898 RepID=UPI00361D18D4